MADTPDSTLALYLFTKLKLRLSIIGSWGEIEHNYTKLLYDVCWSPRQWKT